MQNSLGIPAARPSIIEPPVETGLKVFSANIVYTYNHSDMSLTSYLERVVVSKNGAGVGTPFLSLAQH
jgi:hypothetical protein